VPVVGSVARHLRRHRMTVVPRHLRSEAGRAGDATLREVRDRTPVGERIDPETGAYLGPSGVLLRSIRKIGVRPDGEGGYETGAYTLNRVAGIVEHGAPPHWIHPRRGHFLRWWDGPGNERFARSVHHPGFEGRFMFAQGVNAALVSEMLDANTRLQLALERGWEP
jgi:hypothetical protein